MRKYLLPVAGLVLMVASNGAFAAQATSTFNVKVAVNAACTVSAGDINFGTFTGNITATTTTSSATVTCNKGTAYNLSFAAASSTGSASVTMASGVNTIPATVTMSNGSQNATGGSDLTTITGTLAAVTGPVPGSYTVAQSIYINY